MEESFAPLFVEHGGDGDEFAGVVPFVVAEEDVQGVEFQDLNACVQVPWCIGAASFNRTCASGSRVWGGGRLKTGRDVQVGGSGGCEVGF